MTRHSLLIAGLCGLLLALAGCGSLVAWWPVVLLALSLGLSACVKAVVYDEEDEADAASVLTKDAGRRDAAEPDVGTEPGAWEECCQQGVITSCFCPANSACNYGMFVDCPDGTCSVGPSCPPEPPEAHDAATRTELDAATRDAGMRDAGPDAAIRDPGMDAAAGDAGSDASSTDAGLDAASTDAASDDAATHDAASLDAETDAAASDAASDADGGSWQTCCGAGRRITTCYCPAGAICNYAWYTPCGDGACAPGPRLLDASIESVCSVDAAVAAQ